VALVGSGDTLLGDRDLVIDAAAGTVRLGSGPARPIPGSGSAAASDFVVVDEHGAEVHLDFSAWDGTSSTSTLHGDGSVSLDGVDWTPVDPSQTDLELEDPASGAVLHLDMSGMVRAVDDLATFSGQANIFDVIEGMAQDLENAAGLSSGDVQQRLAARLVEFDKNQDALLSALGTLGARAERLVDADGRLQDMETHLASLLSSTEDADLSSTILEMSKAEQTLQLAQATGSRLLNTTLLNYLR
jgi:flagellin-like hook-associated protein FlgL